MMELETPAKRSTLLLSESITLVRAILVAQQSDGGVVAMGSFAVVMDEDRDHCL